MNTDQRTCSRDQRAEGEAIRVHVCWSRARLRRSRPTDMGAARLRENAERACAFDLLGARMLSKRHPLRPQIEVRSY
jgi:hypothetical protein